MLSVAANRDDHYVIKTHLIDEIPIVSFHKAVVSFTGKDIRGQPINSQLEEIISQTGYAVWVERGESYITSFHAKTTLVSCCKTSLRFVVREYHKWLVENDFTVTSFRGADVEGEDSFIEEPH